MAKTKIENDGYDDALIADGWQAYKCQSCSGYHVELIDGDNRCIAMLTIPPEDFAEFGVMLLRMAVAVSGAGAIH